MKLEYKLIEKIGEGTFSDVLKAKNIISGEYYAIKCIKEKMNRKKVLYFQLLVILFQLVKIEQRNKLFKKAFIT